MGGSWWLWLIVVMPPVVTGAYTRGGAIVTGSADA